MKQPYFIRKITTVLLIGLCFLCLSPALAGADAPQGNKGTNITAPTGPNSTCKTIILSDGTCQKSYGCKNSSAAELRRCLQSNPIVKDLNTVVTFLSAAVGIAVIGALIYGGIRYSIAGDNPQQVSIAKQKIINALIALVFYISIFSIVQWLIPGGLFG